MVSIEGKIKRIFTGDFRGVLKPSKTVTIEQEPDNPSRKRLRFGKDQDDYFCVMGDSRDIEALQEIVSKVIESPSQLKKIKDLSLEDRPVLLIAHGSGNVGGYCNGQQIAIAASKGTGYNAAATFVHELQHQYQFKRDGISKYKGNLSLAEDILDDRLCESAAQTAAYQYLYEMKDRNFQSRNVYRNSCRQDGWYSQGLVEYSAAKDANKSEPECILAGMKGYASSYGVARSYERDYHRETVSTPPLFGVDQYADYLQAGRKEEVVKQIHQILGGDRLDETAAFISHTKGMTDQQFSQQGIKETVRSKEFSYITSATARFIKKAKETYEKFCGHKHEKADVSLSVRTEAGLTNTEQFHKNDPQQVIDDMFSGKSKKGSKSLYEVSLEDGREFYSLDGRNKDPNDFSAAFFYRSSIDHERWEDSGLSVSELKRRESKLYATFSILMQDKKLRQELLQSSSSNPLIVGFGQKPEQNSGNMIALDPQKTPELLAQDFRNQWTEVKENLQQKEKPQENSDQKGSLNAKLLSTGKGNKAQQQSKEQPKRKAQSFFRNLMGCSIGKKAQRNMVDQTALMLKTKKER